MPGEQEVVWFEVRAGLNRVRVRSFALERHHGLHVETHQLSVQIL